MGDGIVDGQIMQWMDTVRKNMRATHMESQDATDCTQSSQSGGCKVNKKKIKKLDLHVFIFINVYFWIDKCHTSFLLPHKTNARVIYTFIVKELK